MIFQEDGNASQKMSASSFQKRRFRMVSKIWENYSFSENFASCWQTHKSCVVSRFYWTHPHHRLSDDPVHVLIIKYPFLELFENRILLQFVLTCY
jgi:hypothetical protein